MGDAPAVVAQLVGLVVERELTDDIGELGQRSGIRIGVDARLGCGTETEAEAGVQDLLRTAAARRGLECKQAGAADRRRRGGAGISPTTRLGGLSRSARPRSRLAVRVVAHGHVAATAIRRPSRADRRTRVADLEPAVLTIPRASSRSLGAYGRIDDRRRLPRAAHRPVRSRRRGAPKVGREQIPALLVRHELLQQGLGARIVRGDERAEESLETVQALLRLLQVALGC